MDLGPLLRILFGADGSGGVGVIVIYILFQAGGDGLRLVVGDHGEQARVGLVGETVTTRSNRGAGVEIAVGDEGGDGVEVGEVVA